MSVYIIFKLGDIWVKDWSDDHVVSCPGYAGELSLFDLFLLQLTWDWTTRFFWVSEFCSCAGHFTAPFIESFRVRTSHLHLSSWDYWELCFCLYRTFPLSIQSSADHCRYTISNNDKMINFVNYCDTIITVILTVPAVLSIDFLFLSLTFT